MAPSINIIFFAIYIWFFISEYFLFDSETKDLNFLNLNFKSFVFTYFIINFIFCSSTILKDLASYTPNLAIFITGSISFYIIFSSGLLGERKFGFISLFLLTIFAPLLKTSALTICFLNIGYLIIYFVRSDFTEGEYKNFYERSFRKIFLYLNIQNIVRFSIVIPLLCS